MHGSYLLKLIDNREFKKAHGRKLEVMLNKAGSMYTTLFGNIICYKDKGVVIFKFSIERVLHDSIYLTYQGPVCVLVPVPFFRRAFDRTPVEDGWS